MRKILLLSLCTMIFVATSAAQDIKMGEYFFDKDPGYGNGKVFAVTAEENFVSVPVSELDPGAHILSMRLCDDAGNWSATYSRSFYLLRELPSSMSGIEYFIDSDPGYGMALPVDVSAEGEHSIDIDVNALSEGFHTLGLRGLDNAGNWSATYSRSFYLLPELPSSMSGIEYFIDSDPGYGMALPVDVSAEGEHSIDIDVNALSEGCHTLGLRGLDNVGNWSEVWNGMFYAYRLSNIVRVEYFIDEDPGEGNAIAVDLPSSAGTSHEVTFNVDVENLSVGNHVLSVRAMDELGQWSTVSEDPFEVTQGTGIIDIENIQPVSVKITSGECIVERDGAYASRCNVLVMALDGKILAQTIWEEGKTNLSIPIGSVNGQIVLVSVVNCENETIRTTRRVLVK